MGARDRSRTAYPRTGLMDAAISRRIACRSASYGARRRLLRFAPPAGAAIPRFFPATARNRCVSPVDSAIGASQTVSPLRSVHRVLSDAEEACPSSASAGRWSVDDFSSIPPRGHSRAYAYGSSVLLECESVHQASNVRVSARVLNNGHAQTAHETRLPSTALQLQASDLTSDG